MTRSSRSRARSQRCSSQSCRHGSSGSGPTSRSPAWRAATVGGSGVARRSSRPRAWSRKRRLPHRCRVRFLRPALLGGDARKLIPLSVSVGLGGSRGTLRYRNGYQPGVRAGCRARRFPRTRSDRRSPAFASGRSPSPRSAGRGGLGGGRRAARRRGVPRGPALPRGRSPRRGSSRAPALRTSRDAGHGAGRPASHPSDLAGAEIRCQR